MRYRLLASYRGAPYEAGVGPTDADIVLFAACPPPEELGFEPATGHWRKQVRPADVQTLHESRPVGVFRGERCVVLDDLGDRLHIMYLGHDAYRAEQIGYWEVDRGVFELIAPRHEVTELVEQRLAFPGHPSGPPPAPGHQAPGQGSGQPYEPAGFPTGTGYPADPPYLGSTGHQAQDSHQPTVANGSASGPYHLTSQADSYLDQTAQPDAAMTGPDNPPAEFGPAGPAGYDQQAHAAVAGHLAAQPTPGPPADLGQPVPLTGLGTADGHPGLPGPAHAAEPERDPSGYLTGVAMPLTDEPPLPLEAEALRAATAAHRRDQADNAAHADRPGQPIQARAAMPEAAPAQAPPTPAEALVSPQHSPAIDIPAEQVQARSVPQPAAAAPHAPAAESGPAAAQDQTAAEPGTLAATPVAVEYQPAQPAPPTSDEPALTGLAAAPPALIAAPPALIAAPPVAAAAPLAPRQPAQPQDMYQPPGGNGSHAGPSVQPPGHDQQVAQPPDRAPARSELAAAPTELVAQPAPQPELPPQPEPAAQPEPPPQPEPGQPEPGQPEPALATAAHMRQPADPTVRPADQIQTSAAVALAVNQAEPDAPTSVAPRRRRAAKRRLPTQRIFSDLASQAAIPASAYAVGEEVDGAMCLVNTGEGFEVFNSAAGARHEVRVFTDEESAYFYLFGVLVADAVRTGALVPRPE